MKYEFLDRIRITLHPEHLKTLSSTTLEEIQEYQDFEFYSAAKLREISKNNAVQDELDRLINMLQQIRTEYPKGSNQECMCTDQLTEFLGKLDLEDFRKIDIAQLKK